MGPGDMYNLLVSDDILINASTSAPDGPSALSRIDASDEPRESDHSNEPCSIQNPKIDFPNGSLTPNGPRLLDELVGQVSGTF